MTMAGLGRICSKKIKLPLLTTQHSHRLYFHLYQNKFRKIVPQFHWERYDKYLQGYMGAGEEGVDGGGREGWRGDSWKMQMSLFFISGISYIYKHEY